jgi:predicted protein tyrosine phosphatase
VIAKVKVYNRFNMGIVAQFGRDSGFPFCGRRWHLVSVYTGDKQSPLYLTDETVAALKGIGMAESLSLEFWDITDSPRLIEELKVKYPQYILFSEEQAAKVAKFMADRKAEKGDDILVVHCDAGISRSGAIAEFACEFFGMGRKEFLKENPYLHANPMVLRMLRNAAGMAQESAFTWQREREAEQRKKEFENALDKYGHVFI